MFPCRHFYPFIIKCIKSRDNFFPCHCRINNLINISAFICNKRICNFIAVFFNQFFFKFNRIFRFSKFFPVKNCNCSIRSHNSNFCGRPGKTEITSKIFTVHNNECSAVSFSENDSYLRYSSFAVCKQQFCAMT